MNQLIKATIAIFCLLCLLKMPYGFYGFVRLIAFVGFLYLAYVEFNNGIKILALPCVLIALLFNPIIKVYLKRGTWNNIDIIVASLLVVWIIFDLLKPKKYKYEN